MFLAVLLLLKKMETTEVKDKRETFLKSVVKDPKRMTGVWELKIDVKNAQGLKAFGGKILSDYIHPLTGKRVHLINMDNQIELGLHLARPTTVYRPDDNPMDRRIVDWLLCHPKVGVEGIDITDGLKAKKESNPLIHLKNVDRQEMGLIDNEDKIDVIIGRLSDNNPKTGISLERLRYLLAYFNLPYFDIRYIKNKETEKKFLRQKIKNFARNINSDGSLNAEKVEAVLNEIDNLRYNYEFKEMLRNSVIKESHGIYKYNNVPLGSTDDSVISFFKNNLEVYTEMVGQLYPILKEQGFTFKA